MTQTLFRNCRVWDVDRSEPEEGIDVLVEGDRIKEVSDARLTAAGAAIIEADGRTLMPGLIDAHVHAVVSTVSFPALAEVPVTLMTAEAARALGDMLARGFTSVRDCGGADWGLAEAVRRGLIVGPRVFHSGRALSQTGGHGDYRPRSSDAEPCGCANALEATTRIADGVDAVRKAARDELRKGATQIKVMVSGGVTSPYDPIETRQYSAEELTAIVDEAEAWNTYVAAHAYTPRSIVHAVNCGVRTIEHANLIDAEAARIVAEKSAYVVPTLVTFEALHQKGRDLGLSDVSMSKLSGVLDAGLRALETCIAAGVRLGLGSDLLGPLRDRQSRELALQAEIQTTREVLVSATAVNAEILGLRGQLGVVAVGALADLLLVDGDPLEDLGLLQGQGRHLAIVMKGGVVHANRFAG
jgi:imidazolonepropionase-like amidohydrolase